MISGCPLPLRALVVVALTALAGTTPHAADEIDLFSPQRGQQAAPAKQALPAPPTPKPVRPKPPKRAGGKPFVLRGTSRISSRYTAIIQVPTGGDVRVRWRPGEVAEIPGFEGYQVTSVRAREVRLVYPEGSECSDELDSGVRCAAGGQSAILSLVRRDAKAPPKPVAPKANGKPAANNPVAVNPFKAALERAKAGRNAPPADPKVAAKQAKELADRREKYKNFKPKTINPDEVPAGMKVVHTPFGDRLVPER